MSSSLLLSSFLTRKKKKGESTSHLKILLIAASLDNPLKIFCCAFSNSLCINYWHFSNTSLNTLPCYCLSFTPVAETMPMKERIKKHYPEGAFFPSHPVCSKRNSLSVINLEIQFLTWNKRPESPFPDENYSIFKTAY